MEHHQDEHITCADCGTTFVFTAAEADSFASKRLDPPKRCFDCRRARKAQREGGAPDHRPSFGRDGGPRHGGHGGPRGQQLGGDVNGYRSPMSDPSGDARARQGEYRAPGFRDSRPAVETRQGGFRDGGPRDSGYRDGVYRDNSGPRDGGFRGGPQGGGGGRGDYRAPSFGGDQGPRGGGDYRAPSFGGDRSGPPGFRGRPSGGFRGGPGGPGGGRPDSRGPGGPGGGPRGPRGDGRSFRGGDRPYNDGPRRDDRGPRPYNDGPRHDAPRHAHGHDHPQGDAPRRERPEKPSYPITCAQCGASAEVPFKPQEGREILCRTCYRAKKDAAG